VKAVFYVEGFDSAVMAETPDDALHQAKRYASLILVFARKSQYHLWEGARETRSAAAKLLARKTPPKITLAVPLPMGDYGDLEEQEEDTCGIDGEGI
jgi:hypothetical protein